MRILLYIDRWPSRTLAGSEMAAYRLARWLLGHGHDVKVRTTTAIGGTFGGIRSTLGSPSEVAGDARRADVIITHQRATQAAAELGRRVGRPVAAWAHNWHWFGGYADTLAPERDLVVWNSQALATHMAGRWSGRSTVLHPPVFPADYAGVSGSESGAITQVNLSDVKGGLVFHELSRRIPDVRFIGVLGGWGKQIYVRRWPPNVTILPTTPDLSAVWARTSILLVPTGKVADNQTGESFGLVALEAICCGIPVIASPSPGMAEAAGAAAVFIDPADVDAWEVEIRRLLDGWQPAHEAAKAAAAALDPDAELHGFVDTLESLACKV